MDSKLHFVYEFDHSLHQYMSDRQTYISLLMMTHSKLGNHEVQDVMPSIRLRKNTKEVNRDWL